MRQTWVKWRAVATLMVGVAGGGGMKRLLAVLIVMLGLSVAQAEGAHLGVRLGLPFLIGVHAGYDFGSFGSGFGVGRGVR
jgi:hypothetical protein